MGKSSALAFEFLHILEIPSWGISWYFLSLRLFSASGVWWENVDAYPCPILRVHILRLLPGGCVLLHFLGLYMQGAPRRKASPKHEFHAPASQLL